MYEVIRGKYSNIVTMFSKAVQALWNIIMPVALHSFRKEESNTDILRITIVQKEFTYS